jgi:hypothetical protein
VASANAEVRAGAQFKDVRLLSDIKGQGIARNPADCLVRARDDVDDLSLSSTAMASLLEIPRYLVPQDQRVEAENVENRESDHLGMPWRPQ